MTPKATHYEVLNLGVDGMGSEPNKRFLQKTMSGSNWTSQGYAHKFLDLGEAVKEQRQHKNSYIIWVDETLASDFPCWGEVNRDYITRTY